MKKLAGNNIIKGQAAVELAIFGSIILVAFSVLLMYGQRLDSQQQVKMEAFRRALQKAYERNGSVSYTLKKESRAVNLFGGFGQGQASTVGSTASVMWQKGMSGPPQSDKGESYSYYVINDTPIGTSETFKDSDGQTKSDVTLPRYPLIQPSINGGKFTVHVPASVWNEEQVRNETYSSSVRKQESSGGKIINAKSSDLKDTVKVTLHTRLDKSKKKNYWDDTPLPDYVYEGGSYTHEGKKKTIKTTGSLSLGAYQRSDINRVDYSKDKVGTTIHREREWQTNK